MDEKTKYSRMVVIYDEAIRQAEELINRMDELTNKAQEYEPNINQMVNLAARQGSLTEDYIKHRAELLNKLEELNK